MKKNIIKNKYLVKFSKEVNARIKKINLKPIKMKNVKHGQLVTLLGKKKNIQ